MPFRTACTPVFIAALCCVPASAPAVVQIDTCGATWTGAAVLTADLDCSLAAEPLQFGPGSLDLNGHTLTGGDGTIVTCGSKSCRYFSSVPGGRIVGDPLGFSTMGEFPQLREGEADRYDTIKEFLLEVGEASLQDIVSELGISRSSAQRELDSGREVGRRRDGKRILYSIRSQRSAHQ